MITGELKSRIDRLWEAFWTGGITNPLTVIEQISYLMFCRMLDIRETTAEKKEAQLGKSVTKLFNSEEQHLRWSRLRHMESQAMHNRFILTELGGLSFGYGLVEDENSNKKFDDIFILDQKHYSKKWKDYFSNKSDPIISYTL